MASVNFFVEEVEFKLKDKNLLKKWIQRIVAEEDKSLSELNFIFCSDNYLHHINLKYLRHDTYTDIITFDRSEDISEISGDIYISIERIAENSRDYSVSFLQELHRVMAHGVLHLIGFQDKEGKDKELMTLKENECLSIWNNIKCST